MRKINALWFFDKFAIFFIFLCVFAFDFVFVGIRLRYLVLMCLLFLTPILCKDELKNKNVINFLFLVLFFYTILTGYSIFVKGNDIENVVFFIKPFMIFALIPCYTLLFNKYGAERYMKFFLLFVLLLVGMFVYVLVQTIETPGYGLRLNDEQGLILVAVYDFLPRIVIKTFVFLIPAAAFLISKYNGIKMHLCCLIMIIFALLSMTIGLVVAIICVYCAVLLFQKKRKELLPLIVVGFMGLILYTTVLNETVFTTKESSADYKTDQMKNFSKDMGGIDLIFGRGIGCEFNDFDSRHVKDYIIEVAAVVVFQSGGLLFSLLFLYAYIGPAIMGVLYSKDHFLQMLSISQIGLFISSLSNPYIWGGTVGLLFVVFIVAYQSSCKKIQFGHE